MLRVVHNWQNVGYFLEQKSHLEEALKEISGVRSLCPRFVSTRFRLVRINVGPARSAFAWHSDYAQARII